MGIVMVETWGLSSGLCRLADYTIWVEWIGEWVLAHSKLD